MSGETKSLLFVDDNTELTAAYAEVLPSYGYFVATADNGKKGLAKLINDKYDILLLDMRMPDISGEEFFKELISNPTYKLNKDIPVAIFTAYPDNDTRKRLLDIGVASYLIKPFEAQALASVLDNLLESEKRRKNLISLRRQLEELHRFNYMVFNALPSGLIVLDNSHSIILANITAHDIFLAEHDSLKGKNLVSLVGQDNLEYIISMTNSDTNVTREIDVDINGVTITAGFSISSLTNRDLDQIGRVLIFRDIATLKAKSEETNRIERLASLGTLASGIAHEVKNPLAGIKAMAQLIEDSTRSDPRTFSFAQRIIGQVDRLNKLLNGFFSIARQKKTERILFPLSNVLRELSPLISGTAKKRKVSVEIECEDSYEVFARPDQTQQVLLNLLLNALDAVEPHAKIRIEVDPPIHQASKRPIFGSLVSGKRLMKQPAHSLVIRVIDDGPGIPEDILKRIFDPFFTTKVQGTGLGLFIVHQLVSDELGGSIHVHSEPGSTVFAIILPTRPASPDISDIDNSGTIDLPGTIGLKTISDD